MGNFLALFAAGTGTCADKTFLGLVPWYHYLELTYNSTTKTCEVAKLQILGDKSDLLLILLAVVDDLLRIAGLVAVGFVIYAGIKYITSQGSPDETAKAQSTLFNALIGLVIAVVAVALVSFIGNQIGSGNAAGKIGGTGGADVSSLPNANGVDNGNVLKTILTLVFGVVGALSLLFITIGGVRYIMSQGDPQALTKAKNTILYALVGLVIAIFGATIVSFVIGKV